MFKRFTSMLLAIIMIIGVFPVSAMAENTEEDLASWEGNVAAADEVIFGIRGLTDISGFVSWEYIDGVYTITVTPENITTEQWQTMYQNTLTDQQFIYLYVGVEAPEGTTAAYDVSHRGLKNYNDFAAETENQENFYPYRDESIIDFTCSTNIATTIEENGIVTAFPQGGNYVDYFHVAFYVPENGQIIRKMVPFKVVLEGNVEKITFENPEKHVEIGRIEEAQAENLVSSYNEETGELVYSYSGNSRDAESILNSFESEYLFTTVKAPVINGEQYYCEGETSTEVISRIADDGVLFTKSMKNEIVWENAAGKQYVEYIYIEFNPGISYMDIYWTQIEDRSRLEFVNDYGEVLTVEQFAANGLNVGFDSNGFITVGYELDVNIEIAAKTFVRINAPEGDFVGYKTINFQQNFTGYPSYNLNKANFQDKSMREAEFCEIGERPVLGMLSRLDSMDVGDITFWFTNEQDASRAVLIDWYKKHPDAADFDFEKDVVREYVYVMGEDFIFENVKEALTETELKENGSVEVPTPIIEEGKRRWKLTTNHYPQTKENENVNAFYFQLEGDENTPEGDKVVYLPYSFIDPELDYDKAVEMKLKPKIHHYTDDHSELVEGKPIDGELRPEGIRFVVGSFSPFVLDWSLNGNSPEETLKDRASVQLGIFEEAFQKEISGFRNNEIEGTHVKYKFAFEDVGADELLEVLQSDTEGNPSRNGGFVVKLNAPGEDYSVTGIKIDGENKNVADFVTASGELDGLGWIKYVDNGNLCNASKIYSVTWSNGSETVTDNLMVSLVFPQVPPVTADRTALAMPNNIQAYFNIRGNGNGDYLEYYWNEEEATEESVKEVLSAFEGRIPVVMDAPNETFSKVKKISWNGTDHTEDFKVNGEIVFEGLIMFYNYLDGNGKLQNQRRDFEIIWTDSTGTKEYVDEITVALVFPQVEENQGGNEPERQPSSNSGENDYPDAVTIEISSALDGVLYEYDPETGAAEFVIAENDPEDWQTAYVDEGAVMSNIYATVIIQAPDWAVGFNGANGGDYFLEEFIERTESEDNEFDPVRNGDPYYRSYIELAHITRNETTGKVTVSLMEENLWTHLAWVDQGGNIVYQSVNLISSVVEGTTEIYTFDDAFANVQTIAPEDFNNRIEINEITSNQMTEEDSEGNLNYNDGILTLTYTGEGTDYESVKDSFVDEIGADGYGEVNMSVYPPAAGYKPYKMEFSSGWYNPKENDETLPVWGMFYGEERVFNDDEYYLYWISEDGSDFIIEKIGISFKFPFKNIWMEKYWKPLSYGEEDSRLKITVGTSHSTAVEYTLEELEEKGAIITIEDGYIAVSFADNADIYTITNIIAQVEPPEGAVYYKHNNSSAPNLLDYEYADDQNAIILSDKTRTIAEDGKPRLDLSGFDVYEVNGLDVYVSYISGITRVQIIDWYNANNEIIQRDYYYSVGDDYCVTQVAEAVEEENLGKVEAPTPVLGENDANWKLTTNHYPQTKENENVNAYYFQLEGDENTPEGDKVVYLPYSFIDPELDYDKAVEMKLEPKIHHYKEDHKTLVEGEPIDGELRPEGIRFVVGSFSPFVLAWEKENHEFGETTYEWSENGKNCEAKRICLVCEDHTETVKASVSGKKVKEPTCTEKGQTEYTAVFEADWAEEQKKTVSDIPETGHDWNKPAYEWSEDGKSCEAKRICKNDEDHTETVKASVSGKKVKEPTCTEKGWTEYTAVFEADWAEDQKKIASDIPETGHRWDKGEIVEEPTCTEEGTRLHTCLNDKNHTKEEDIPVDRDAHSFGKWKTVIKATEDREGKRVKICSECGKKVYEIIPMKDGNAIIISGTEREEDEENPNTGAAAFSAAALVSVIGAAGVFLLGKKR